MCKKPSSLVTESIWLCLAIFLTFRPAEASPHRIVSLAPSITETLFALGAGDQVVGVTEFCAYPPEAKRLPKIGGFYDSNYEAILALHPDLVVLLPETEEQRRHLQALHIKVLTVEQHTLVGVMSSFISLGTVCGREAQGAWWAERFRGAIVQAHARTRGLPKPKVLLVLGRDYGGDQIREVYVAARGEIYDQILELAGGVNAYQRQAPKYPKLSAEGIVSLDPDVILELVPETGAAGTTPEQIRAAWGKLPGVHAGRHRKIAVLTGDYLTIPGPRLLLTLQAIGQVLHPELSWE